MRPRILHWHLLLFLIDWLCLPNHFLLSELIFQLLLLSHQFGHHVLQVVYLTILLTRRLLHWLRLSLDLLFRNFRHGRQGCRGFGLNSVREKIRRCNLLLGFVGQSHIRVSLKTVDVCLPLPLELLLDTLEVLLGCRLSFAV